MIRTTLMMTAAALVVAAPLSAQYKDNSGASDTPPASEEAAPDATGADNAAISPDSPPADDEAAADEGVADEATADGEAADEADAEADATGEDAAPGDDADTADTGMKADDAASDDAASAEPVAEESGAVQEAASETPVTMVPRGVMISAGAVEDATIYSLSGEYDETFWASGESFGAVAAAWNEIGSVDDVVLNDAAEVLGVTVDVGGFLGIGERTVLLPVEDIRLVQLPEDEGFFIVTRMSREQIENTEGIEGLAGQ